MLQGSLTSSSEDPGREMRQEAGSEADAPSRAVFGCGGRRRRARTTLRSPTERTPLAPDLVNRDFAPEAPDRPWVADIAYVGTWQGWLYLSSWTPTPGRSSAGP